MGDVRVDYTTDGFAHPGLSEAERFFYEHAGYGYNPGRETADEGRVRRARELARAESHATAHGWRVDWEPDENAMWDDDVERETEDYDQYLAILRDDAGEILYSLGSIDLGPGQVMGYDARPHRFEGGPIEGRPLVKVYDPYVRVVEAELADEAMRYAGEQ